MIRLAFSIAMIQWKQLVRDRRAFIMLIAFPVVLTSILSFALGGWFSGTGHQVFKVAVVNQDSGKQGSGLEDFLKRQTAFVKTVDVATRDEAMTDLTSGKADVAVIIPDSYSSLVAKGQQATLTVAANGVHQLAESVVTQLVSGYGLQMADIAYVQTAGISPSLGLQPVAFNQTGSGLKPVTAGSYYAIGMMVMFLLSNGVNRASSMVSERNSDRYKRLLAAPVGHVTLAIGQWLATFLIMAAQGAILLLCSRFILQIHLGPIFQTALILLGYAASIAGIATVLGSFIQSLQVVNGIAGIGANIAAVLGGSIFPLYGFPQVMQWIGKVLPNGQALTRLVDSVMGVSTSELWIPFFYLLVLGMFLGALGGFRYGTPQRRGV